VNQINNILIVYLVNYKGNYMLKKMTVVVKMLETGAKIVLGHSYSDKILAQIFCLKP